MPAPVTAILGLGRQVGFGVARRFHEAGHRVLATDPSMKRTETAREQLPEAIEVLQAALDDEIGVRNALAATVEAYDRIDNVVVIPPLPKADALDTLDTLDTLDQSPYEKSIQSALSGAALIMKLAAERMADIDDTPASGIDRARQQGTVTFILSITAALPSPGRFTESVSQGAILAAMRAGALELAPQRVRVNAICAIRPRAETSDDWLKKRTPLGRAALADEIGDAAIYLSSPEAAIVTGATLTLDGGRSVLNGLTGLDEI